jgi:hypothetical protein
MGTGASRLPTEMYVSIQVESVKLTYSDDDCITPSGYLECTNPVPLIAGFNILTRTVT